MMPENVTKTYKKCNTNKSTSINFKAKQIASKLKIDDRVQKLDENEAYVTIKDYKEGFAYKISCRLMNPSKTDIGKISKQILDRVNNTILEKNKVNQWKNTSSVIEWYFKCILQVYFLNLPIFVAVFSEFFQNPRITIFLTQVTKN